MTSSANEKSPAPNVVQGILVLCGKLVLASHQFCYARGKVDGILGQDAFDKECLIVEHRAVFTERILVICAVDRLKRREQLVVRIELEDTLCLEYGLVRLSEKLFHCKADTLLCADEADSTRFETRRKTDFGYLFGEGCFDIFEKRVVIFCERFGFLFFLCVDITEIEVAAADGVEFLAFVFAQCFECELVYVVRQLEDLDIFLTVKLHLRKAFDRRTVFACCVVDRFLFITHTTDVLLERRKGMVFIRRREKEQVF